MKKLILGLTVFLLLFYCFFLESEAEEKKEKYNIEKEIKDSPKKQKINPFEANNKDIDYLEVKKNKEKELNELDSRKLEDFLEIINKEAVEFSFSVDYLDDRYKKDIIKREKLFYGLSYQEHILKKPKETVSGVYSNINPIDFFNLLELDEETNNNLTFLGKTIDVFGNEISFDYCLQSRKLSFNAQEEDYKEEQKIRRLSCTNDNYGILIKSWETTKDNGLEKKISYKLETILFDYSLIKGSETFEEMEMLGRSIHSSYFFENESNGYILN